MRKINCEFLNENPKGTKNHHFLDFRARWSVLRRALLCACAFCTYLWIFSLRLNLGSGESCCATLMFCIENLAILVLKCVTISFYSP